MHNQKTLSVSPLLRYDASKFFGGFAWEDRLGGRGSRVKILFCFDLIDSKNLEYVLPGTELKKLFSLPRYDVAKLGPTYVQFYLYIGKTGCPLA